MEARLEKLEVSVYTVPNDAPESDGTFEWDSTTMVLVVAHAGNLTGLGYTYADRATAVLIQEKLAPVVLRLDALDVLGAWTRMVHAVRNLGRSGVASMAISAVDNALWDLKARLLNVPLVKLLGQVRKSIPAYGSGGFTSYKTERLQEQLGGWVQEGMTRVKMKVGRYAPLDVERVAAARDAIGPETHLFVDANGAYARKQALKQAEDFFEFGVSWFEEPVPSWDAEGLRLLRDRGPEGMDIAAGEYGYSLLDFKRLLEAGAVDVLQADATRCSGITGFLQVGALCKAHALPLSSHCAPALHAQPDCAVEPVVHAEYFYDHARIEKMFFDGFPEPQDGHFVPDLSRPGLGLEFREADSRRYRISGGSS